MSKENKTVEATIRPSEQQIKDWKKEHGNVYGIEVEDGKETRLVILRDPKLKDLEVASAIAQKTKKPMEFNKSIFANCKLYADSEVESNDKNFLAVLTKLDEIVEIRDAQVKKL